MIGTPEERDEARRHLDEMGLSTSDHTVDLYLVFVHTGGDE